MEEVDGMATMRHLPHLRVRILPEWNQAGFVLVAYGLISIPVWLFPMPDMARLFVACIILLPGMLRIAHALQWTGPWSVREIVLTGGGRWILVDSRLRREPAQLLHVGQASMERIELQFRDRHWRIRTVTLNGSTSSDEHRQRLAARLVYGFQCPPSLREGIA